MLLSFVKRANNLRVRTSANIHTLSIHTPPFVRYNNNAAVMGVPKSPDAISRYIKELPKRYNAIWIEKIVSSLSATLPVFESQQILRSLIVDNNEKNLKHLRGVLAEAGKGKLTFEPLEVFQVVSKCVEKGDVVEAIQWLILAQEQPGFVPSHETLRLLMAASAAAFESWDCLFFVLGEMKRLAVPFAAADVEVMVKSAVEAPHSRWRAVRDVVFSPEDAATGTVSVAVAGLSSQTLLQALQVIADAQQYATVISVFGGLHGWAANKKKKDSEDAQEMRALFANALGPLGSAAVASQDFSFLQKVLLATTSSTDTDIGTVTGTGTGVLPTVSPEAASETPPAEWLETFVQSLWEKSAFEAGAHVGLVVAWHLGNSNADAAVKMWNDYLAAVRRCQEESVLDLQSEATQALNETVQQLFSFCTKTSGSSQVLVARFLHSVLFNDASGAAPPPLQKPDQKQACMAAAAGLQGVAGVNFSIQSASAAQQMLGLLTLTQDVEGASVVLSRSLKAGHLVSQSIMTALLELLFAQKDYQLVLELTDLYLTAEKDNHLSRLRVWANPSSTKKTNKTSDSTKVPPPKPLALPRVAAPFLFLPALQSLAQLGDVDGMLGLVSNTIPSIGYIPRVEFYRSTMEAMARKGEHERAVQLFAASQDLYKQLAARSSEVRHNLTTNYGIGATSLVLAALHACAEGRLAVPAMEIFASYEDAKQKNVERDSKLLDMHLLTELVTSADFVEIVPQFLRSLRGLRTPVVPTRQVLQVALAAAVSQQNAAVAKEVAAIIKQNHGCDVNQVVSLSGLLASLREKFSVTDEESVQSFLLGVEELKNIH